MACILVSKRDMSILRFMEDFPDERSCRIHFKAQREK
ncbi:MAG: hypothetical protein ACI9FN_003182, partial [Saprospiraceae bacterium]